ncbi:K(+)-transporting ATPase subunit F [Desulfobacterium sp. N47]
MVYLSGIVLFICMAYLIYAIINPDRF